VRLLVPLDTSEGVESKISDHFGRARYIAIIDVSEGGVKVVELSEFSRDLGMTVAEYVIEKNADGVAVKGIGPRAFEKLTSSGIKVFRTECGDLKCLLEELLKGSLEGASPECPP